MNAETKLKIAIFRGLIFALIPVAAALSFYRGLRRGLRGGRR